MMSTSFMSFASKGAWFCAVSFVFAFACSSSSSDRGSSGTTANDSSAVVIDYCQAVHDSTVVCDAAEAATKLDQCKANYVPCALAVYRSDVLAALDDCAKTQQCAKGSSPGACSCTPSEDECAFRAAGAVAATAVGAAYESACKAKYTECGGASNSFGNDYCVGTMFNDDTARELQKCFDLACGDYKIGLCLKQGMLEKSAGKCDKSTY